MKVKRAILFIYIAALAVALLVPAASTADEQPAYSTVGQPDTISAILSKENKIVYLKQAIELLNAIDATYVDIEKTSPRAKAHRFRRPGARQARERRMGGQAGLSATGLTEEYYSIMLSRELYRVLSANRFIEIRSTDDFMQVMKGKSDIYRNIPFVETVRMATEAGAFIIVSEHLNISSIVKASGLMNIPGVHITTDKWGNRFLVRQDIHRDSHAL